MRTEQLLENRHTVKLAWVEPHPARREDGQAVDAAVELRATVNDCINMRRLVHLSSKHAHLPITDRDLLLDFMAVHWATPVNDDKGKEKIVVAWQDGQWAILPIEKTEPNRFEKST